eukprot:TRINITY_DN2157_c0_g2_i1.p1 TRINITY_DN2157_c0_g2~~TRINITY_DN2157_c0_g2_i1.p1  ORF type:complete len:259 (-),score=31.29 TRINITY_DN2157_c0_g2_i1:137-913(-)
MPYIALNFHQRFQKGVPLRVDSSLCVGGVGCVQKFADQILAFLSDSIEGRVQRLTDANFESKISTGNNNNSEITPEDSASTWMVQFTAPFDECQRCMHSYHLWWRLSSVVSSPAQQAALGSVKIGRVMCGGDAIPSTQRTCERYMGNSVTQQQHFPALKYFARGSTEGVDYTGLWHVDEITKFLSLSTATTAAPHVPYGIEKPAGLEPAVPALVATDAAQAVHATTTLPEDPAAAIAVTKETASVPSDVPAAAVRDEL